MKGPFFMAQVAYGGLLNCAKSALAFVWSKSRIQHRFDVRWQKHNKQTTDVAQVKPQNSREEYT